MEDLLGGDAGPATGPLLPRADAGAPVYFYEFQHGPQCLKDTRPAFVKADHSDEIRFVFGGAFLKGDVVMFGKEQAWGGGVLLLQGLELGVSWGEDTTPQPDMIQEPWSTGGLELTSGL